MLCACVPCARCRRPLTPPPRRPQLGFFGFTKEKSPKQIAYTNPLFHAGRKELIFSIKRRNQAKPKKTKEVHVPSDASDREAVLYQRIADLEAKNKLLVEENNKLKKDLARGGNGTGLVANLRRFGSKMLGNPEPAQAAPPAMPIESPSPSPTDVDQYGLEETDGPFEQTMLAVPSDGLQEDVSAWRNDGMPGIGGEGGEFSPSFMIGYEVSEMASIESISSFGMLGAGIVRVGIDPNLKMGWIVGIVLAVVLLPLYTGTKPVVAGSIGFLILLALWLNPNQFFPSRQKLAAAAAERTMHALGQQRRTQVHRGEYARRMALEAAKNASAQSPVETIVIALVVLGTAVASVLAAPHIGELFCDDVLEGPVDWC